MCEWIRIPFLDVFYFLSFPYRLDPRSIKVMCSTVLGSKTDDMNNQGSCMRRALNSSFIQSEGRLTSKILDSDGHALGTLPSEDDPGLAQRRDHE